MPERPKRGMDTEYLSQPCRPGSPPRVLGSAVIRTGEHLKQLCGLQLECPGARALQAHRSKFKSCLHRGCLVTLIWFLSEPEFQHLLSEDDKHSRLGGDEDGEIRKASVQPGAGCVSAPSFPVFSPLCRLLCLPLCRGGTEAGRSERKGEGHPQQRDSQEQRPGGLEHHAWGTGFLGHREKLSWKDVGAEFSPSQLPMNPQPRPGWVCTGHRSPSGRPRGTESSAHIQGPSLPLSAGRLSPPGLPIWAAFSP